MGALVHALIEANRNLLTAMRLLPKSIHWCRRYPTKFNSGRDIPLIYGLFQKGRVLAQDGGLETDLRCG